MYIKSLTLKNFRNYSEQKVNFDKGLNVIFGSNAQGKTNLLEGIYFSAIGKSFKSVIEKDLIKNGESYSDLKIEYFSENRDKYNILRIFTDRKKAVSLNGVPLAKMSELIGNLRVVVFTPEELSLVKEGPGGRRKFLDILICQVYPGYMGILSNYNKALEQKNKLLKIIKQKPEFLETLPMWEEQLIKCGAKIIDMRKKVLNEIMIYANEFHNDISKGKEKIEAKYKTQLCEEISTEEALRHAMEEAREKEIALMSSIIGPHRDEILFLINEKPAKIFASQGQQRTIVLSLKLAQKKYIFETTGETPVMLLDDITGELDIHRREYLFSNLTDSLVFITCTETDRVKDVSGAYFEVKNACVTRKDF
jgi:DNA replication and repair protein RecF